MRVLLGCSFVLLVSACQDSVATAPGRGIAIGGMVSGLAGTGLVLQNNGSDDLDVSSNSAFWFPTRLASGNYAVTVGTQPSSPTQTCTVSGGSGTVNSSDVSTVVVNCASNAYTLGGTVTGLAGSVVLENSNGEHLTVSADGTFAFSTTLVSGANYRVSIASQPDSPPQYCALTAGSGTVADANITSLAVTCVSNNYLITGRVTYLPGGNTIVLANGSDQITLSGAGGFAFPAPLASGSAYNVSIVTQPATGPGCLVSNGSGTIGDTTIDDITVECAPTACTTGNDPETSSAYVVCSDDGTSLWVSANSGGTYHAAQICKEYGFNTFASWNGTCGDVCGFCGASNSCTNLGPETFSDSGSDPDDGTDQYGPELDVTVMWLCTR